MNRAKIGLIFIPFFWIITKVEIINELYSIDIEFCRDNPCRFTSTDRRARDDSIGTNSDKSEISSNDSTMFSSLGSEWTIKI